MAKVEKMYACDAHVEKETSFADFDPCRIVSVTVWDKKDKPEDPSKIIIAETDTDIQIGFSLAAAMAVPNLIINKKGEQAVKGEECVVNTKLLIAKIDKKLQAV